MRRFEKNDKYREKYNNILGSLDFDIYKAIRGETKSARFKYSKTNFEDLKGQGIEKLIIPSSIIDIYTRLEILLGLKLSGHIATSNLIDQLYKRGEIQNEQHYRNALINFSTI